MIKIDRPSTAPTKLTKDGAEATEELKRLFEADSDAYKSGKKKFVFNKNIYGHETVKAALKTAQFDKCCFCERKTEVGHVEHFRGKGGYQQNETETLQYPGYYWLAYYWTNLLFSCETCNSSYKRNFFPLENPMQRATSHHDDISIEKPLIINPSTEDPEKFIEFYSHYPKAIKGNKRGLETIKRTGLDRPFIDDRRREHYLRVKAFYLLSNEPSLPANKRDELRQLITEASHKESEYASMIRCAIKHGFRY